MVVEREPFRASLIHRSTTVRSLMKYLWFRLLEASTWAGIGGAITANYALPTPINYLAMFACSMAIILKGGERK